MFAGLSEENVERVKRQNKRKISVIIGNPPYNANQQNENENNKNREYKRIDELIKSSYIRLSTAQKTKVYDMYARFFRWSSDRMADDGVLAFITNRSFIESRTFDGFRKAVAEEFNEIYVVDLGGDVRANPKLSGTKHNVFGIQTGVAISFMVKRHKQKGCKIFYARRPEFDTALDKLAFLGNTPASAISFSRIEPDKNGNWINLTENDWDELIPVADKKTKAAKSKAGEKAVFRLFGQGLFTGRDEWLYASSEDALSKKVQTFVDQYEAARQKRSFDGSIIKLSRNLKRRLEQEKSEPFESRRIIAASYRPFSTLHLYESPLLVDERGQIEALFGSFGTKQNDIIVLTYPGSQKPFMIGAVDRVFDYHFTGAAAISTGLPRYRYSKAGERIDNITDWALKKFRERYDPKPLSAMADPPDLRVVSRAAPQVNDGGGELRPPPP
jgi:predicted helicase